MENQVAVFDEISWGKLERFEPARRNLALRVLKKHVLPVAQPHTNNFVNHTKLKHQLSGIWINLLWFVAVTFATQVP